MELRDVILDRLDCSNQLVTTTWLPVQALFLTGFEGTHCKGGWLCHRRRLTMTLKMRG